MQSTWTQEQNMEDYMSAIAELNYRLGLLKATKPPRSSAPIKPLLPRCKTPSISVI